MRLAITSNEDMIGGERPVEARRFGAEIDPEIIVGGARQRIGARLDRPPSSRASPEQRTGKLLIQRFDGFAGDNGRLASRVVCPYE